MALVILIDIYNVYYCLAFIFHIIGFVWVSKDSQMSATVQELKKNCTYQVHPAGNEQDFIIEITAETL